MTTKEEKRHLGRVAALGCCVCNSLGYEDSVAAIHHVRHGQGMGQRARHDQAIGLCFRHHQGPEGIHTLGTRAWEKLFGTEQELL